MGHCKNIMMEMEEQGADFTGKYISPDCFSDSNLVKALTKLGNSGICSYSGKGGVVVPMNDAADYIHRYILKYYDDPDQCDLYLANSFLDKGEENDKDSKFTSFGPYLVPKDCACFDDTAELLEELDLYTENEELNADLIEALGDHWWIEKEPFVIPLGDELNLKWKQFSNDVMHRQRFTFLSRDEFNGEPEHTDNGLFDILTELQGIIVRHSLCKKIDKSTHLYRARPLTEKVAHEFKEITCPPDSAAKQNRMSPAGISMFYAAFDDKTPLLEGSDKGDGKGWFLTGDFIPKRDLNVLDLTELPSPITFWLEGFEEIAFLKAFHKEITRPIKRDNRIHSEYVPSQVFTEFLRYMFKGVQLDGMIYNSSLDGEKDIVLFCNQKESSKLLDVVRIDEVDNRCLWSRLCFVVKGWLKKMTK